jgi:hypothetical protein
MRGRPSRAEVHAPKETDRFGEIAPHDLEITREPSDTGIRHPEAGIDEIRQRLPVLIEDGDCSLEIIDALHERFAFHSFLPHP